MELNWAGFWKMHVTTLLYTSGGSASFVASDWGGKIGAWHSWCFQPPSLKGGKDRCSAVTSELSLADLFAAHFSSVSAATAPLCTLKNSSTESGLLARPVPWIWSLPWSHHPRTRQDIVTELHRNTPDTWKENVFKSAWNSSQGAQKYTVEVSSFRKE